jgi:hypothetical protein
MTKVTAATTPTVRVTVTQVVVEVGNTLTGRVRGLIARVVQG